MAGIAEVAVFAAVLLLALAFGALALVRRKQRRRGAEPAEPLPLQAFIPEPPKAEEEVEGAALVGLVGTLARESSPLAVATASGRTRYPVVLVHGLFGFDSIGFGPLRSDYFRGVPARLSALGVEVHVARVPRFANVRTRAMELTRFVNELPAERVNIIAHSMGGLDARYAISRLGLAPRVASLVTIGTPHLGTPLARVAGRLVRAPVMRWLGPFGRPLETIHDLTPEAMEAFNRDVPDAPGVDYTSCVGVAVGSAPARQNARGSLGVHWVSTRLLPAFSRGDGLVPRESQRWGMVLWEIEANHWAQIGWLYGFDAGSFYEQITRTLSARGL